MNNVAEYVELPQEIFYWLNLPEAELAMNVAAMELHFAIQQLNKERYISQNDFHIPMTL
jgi:hypothetical protein